MAFTRRYSFLVSEHSWFGNSGPCFFLTIIDDKRKTSRTYKFYGHLPW